MPLTAKGKSNRCAQLRALEAAHGRGDLSDKQIKDYEKSAKGACSGVSMKKTASKKKGK